MKNDYFYFIPFNKMKFNEVYYSGLHFTQVINEKDVNIFEDILERENCNVFDRIKIIRQIGSKSLYATIWEVDIELSKELKESKELSNEKKESKEKIKLAIKVQKNMEKTLSEIDINNFLQEDQLSRDSFLRYYGNVYCENIDLLKEKTFSGYFMFMELAIGDLAQYIIYSQITEEELASFILDIYEGIYYLGIQQIYHGDLHLRNAFIVYRNNGTKNIKGNKNENNKGKKRAVIGDFGESSATDSITAHVSDLVNFSSSLLTFLESINKFKKIQYKLANVIKTLNRMTPIIEKIIEDTFEQIVRNTVNIAKQIIK